MRITYKKRFEKDFKKLPLNVREQFYERLDIFLQDKFDKILNNHFLFFCYILEAKLCNYVRSRQYENKFSYWSRP